MRNSLFQNRERQKSQTKKEPEILIAHFREINASYGCCGACKRSYSSARLQHGNDGCLIRRKILFRGDPFFHLRSCHPAPFTCTPAKCINEASFTFRLQLWHLSNTEHATRKCCQAEQHGEATYNCIEKFGSIVDTLWQVQLVIILSVRSGGSR